MAAIVARGYYYGHLWKYSGSSTISYSPSTNFYYYHLWKSDPNLIPTFSSRVECAGFPTNLIRDLGLGYP